MINIVWKNIGVFIESGIYLDQKNVRMDIVGIGSDDSDMKNVIWLKKN